jgi:hypothetical protein
MNRAVQKMHQRRCALKNNLYGGGLAVNPGTTFVSDNGVPYAENQHYSDCYTEGRPGALVPQGNPELAQAAMAGGGRRQGCGLMRGGYNIMSAAQLASLVGKRGGTRRQGCGLMRGGQCGVMRGGSRACGCNMRGGHTRGQCGQPQRAWLGGLRRERKTRKMKGGRFEMAVAQNIGGDGPIAEPVRAAIPCDARAGMQNPFTATPIHPDPRAAVGYSLTPNMVQKGGYQLSERVPNFEYSQTGAGYGTGNAYDASCYRAPGSEMPVYPASSAGFHFTPSTEGGAALSDGMTPFNEVVAHTARLGGSRKGSRRKRTRSNRTRSNRKKHAKRAKRSHRNRKH